LAKYTACDLAVELQKFYDGCAIEIRLGDDGYLAEETVRMVAEIVPWLQEAIAHFYPGSSCARAKAQNSGSAKPAARPSDPRLVARPM
jgi:hypothetical protein